MPDQRSHEAMLRRCAIRASNAKKSQATARKSAASGRVHAAPAKSSADGTPSSTGIAGTRNTDDDGAYYDADAATTWTCRAAPISTVDIALFSSSADHTTGAMGDDNLEVQIPDTDSGTSTGYQAFTDGSPTPVDLITGLTVGNGANSVTGDLDLRLNVYDTETTGANTWIVRLRATGSP